jgi:hypothetical protein
VRARKVLLKHWMRRRRRRLAACAVRSTFSPRTGARRSSRWRGTSCRPSAASFRPLVTLVERCLQTICTIAVAGVVQIACCSPPFEPAATSSRTLTESATERTPVKTRSSERFGFPSTER